MKKYYEYELDGVKLYITSNEAVVYRTAEPPCAFRFRHPYTVKIFEQYVRSVKESKITTKKTSKPRKKREPKAKP